MSNCYRIVWNHRSGDRFVFAGFSNDTPCWIVRRDDRSGVQLYSEATALALIAEFSVGYPGDYVIEELP
jgi:hypothetical protein